MKVNHSTVVIDLNPKKVFELVDALTYINQKYRGKAVFWHEDYFNWCFSHNCDFNIVFDAIERHIMNFARLVFADPDRLHHIKITSHSMDGESVHWIESTDGEKVYFNTGITANQLYEAFTYDYGYSLMDEKLSSILEQEDLVVLLDLSHELIGLFLDAIDDADVAKDIKNAFGLLLMETNEEVLNLFTEN